MISHSTCMELHKKDIEPSLDQLEYAWLAPWVWSLDFQAPGHNSPSLAKWILRFSSKGLVDWLKSKNKWTLQFNGASKSNPRVVGRGWILFNPAGIIEYRSAWGLGWKTNNQA